MFVGHSCEHTELNISNQRVRYNKSVFGRIDIAMASRFCLSATQMSSLCRQPAMLRIMHNHYFVCTHPTFCVYS